MNIWPHEFSEETTTDTEDLLFGNKLTKQIKELELKILNNVNQDLVNIQKIKRICQTLKDFKIRYQKIKNEFLRRINRVQSEIEEIGTANKLLNNLLPLTDNLKLTTIDLLLKNKTTFDSSSKESSKSLETIKNNDSLKNTTSIIESTDQAEFLSTLIAESQQTKNTTEETTQASKNEYDEKTFGVWTTPRKINILEKTDLLAEETTTIKHNENIVSLPQDIKVLSQSESNIKKMNEGSSTLITSTTLETINKISENSKIESTKVTESLKILETSTAKKIKNLEAFSKSSEIKPSLKTIKNLNHQTKNKTKNSQQFNKDFEKFESKISIKTNEISKNFNENILENKKLIIKVPLAKPIPSRVLAANLRHAKNIDQKSLLLKEAELLKIEDIISEDDNNEANRAGW